MIGPSLEQCRNCRFWLLDKTTHDEDRPVEQGDIAFGFCRRSAPVVIGALAALCVPKQQLWGRDKDLDDEICSAQLSRASTQPATESGDWCGQFEPIAPAVPL